MAKPATPMIGLGNPNASAWSVRMTDPQLRMGLMLQLGTYAGSSRSAIFSTSSVARGDEPDGPGD